MAPLGYGRIPTSNLQLTGLPLDCMMPQATAEADDPLSDPFIDMSSSQTNKSLRKREREKQRRSDLASAFDELSNLLALVQGNPPAEANERPSKKAKQEQDSLTRFDLIGGTIQCIRNLHRENQQLKRQLAEANSRSGGGSSQGDNNEEVLVMLPTLVPADEQRASSPRAAVGAAAASASTTAAASSSTSARDYPPSHSTAWNGYSSAMMGQSSSHAPYYPAAQPQQGYGYYNPYYYNMPQSQHEAPQARHSRNPSTEGGRQDH